MIKVYLERVKDTAVRDVFERMNDFLTSRKMLWDMKFFDVSIPDAVTKYPYAHGMTTVPKDVILTRKTGTGDLTFEYDKFDDRFIYLTTTGPCQARFFVGTHKEE